MEATLGTPVLRSSLVSPEFREYERTATTVLSAYLTPSVADYLRETRKIKVGVVNMTMFRPFPGDLVGDVVGDGDHDHHHHRDQAPNDDNLQHRIVSAEGFNHHVLE